MLLPPQAILYLVGTVAVTAAVGGAIYGIRTAGYNACELVADVRRTWPTVRVLGHRDLPGVAKTCPGFDVTAWDVGAREPVHGHICAQDPA